MSERENPNITLVQKQFAEGKLDRREFLRYSTLLGMSAAAAYAFVGKVTGESFVTPAYAATKAKGGTVRCGMRIIDVSEPHTFSWVYDSNVARQVVEYMTQTGVDNVTRPSLVEKWDVSDDLKTWNLHVRDVKWHNGRPLTAEDLAWNIRHCLDPDTGSSVVGLMKSYMLKEENGKSVLWDANAIEVVNDKLLRLNLKEPNVAIPEHLFHYPFLILDPEEGGKFKPGSNGTGAFELADIRIGESATLKARSDYWGEGPYIDELIYVDLGDDTAATIGALASKQIQLVYQAFPSQVQAIEAMPHLDLIQAPTGATAIARMQIDHPPFDDPRVRKAFRMSTDSPTTLKLAYQNLGIPAEQHHVCKVHPDFKEIGTVPFDPAGARKLLAEAGHPDGIKAELACNSGSPWEVTAAQVMVEQWKQGGFDIKLNVMPGAQYWDSWLKVPFGMTSWAHRPLGFMALSLAYRTGVPWNESHYSNAEFDKLLGEAEGTLDVDARKEIMGKLEKIMQEDGPMAQPLFRSVLGAKAKNLLGAEKHPTEYIFGNTLAYEA